MPRRPTSTRADVLAARLHAQGLDRAGDDAAALPVWRLGLQDSPTGSAPLALAARLRSGAASVPDLGDTRSFVTIWAERGAPVVLRTGDLHTAMAARWPLDATDATARLQGNGRQLAADGIDPIEAITTVARTMRRAVGRTSRTKGEVSTAVTAALPDAYAWWCQGCGVHHVGEQLLRLAALPGGVRLEPGASPATLRAVGGWKAVTRRPADAGDALTALVRAYVELLGPATAAQLGAFLGTTAGVAKRALPDDVVEVEVDGRRAWTTEAGLEGLREAAGLTAGRAGRGRRRGAEVVRLLGRSDPWLVARDRELLVPGAAHRKVLWRPIGSPGALLVDGEVLGTWTTATSGSRLTITVTPFDDVPAGVRRAVGDEADHVAAVRGADRLELVFA